MTRDDLLRWRAVYPTPGGDIVVVTRVITDKRLEIAMIRSPFALLSFAVTISAASLAFAQGMGGMPGMNHDTAAPSTPSAPPSAKAAVPGTDLANTVCPVTGDKVGDSKLTETYDGKVYHMCCSDCPKDFEKDPAKFAKLVAADPAKYGVKK
jgi:YHS domain-containing protein